MESKFPSTIRMIRQLCHIMGFFTILFTSYNDYPLLLCFLVILSHTFTSYKPFQDLRGHTHPFLHSFLVILSNNFPPYEPIQGLRGPTHRIFTFEDEVMKMKISFVQVMKMKIRFVQLQLFKFEFNFEDDNLHNIMNMKINFVKVQVVFESRFDLETKIKTKLCLDTIYLYPQNETEGCLCLIQLCPIFFTKHI